jgi:hypothetical protein
VRVRGDRTVEECNGLPMIGFGKRLQAKRIQSGWVLALTGKHGVKQLYRFPTAAITPRLSRSCERALNFRLVHDPSISNLHGMDNAGAS